MTTFVLQVDLARSDAELAEILKQRCAGFGDVRSVKIHRSPTNFALVEMATHYQTLEVAAQYGGSAFGSCALVHLEQADPPG
jgi:RNA recognition motif. (a.k.a. RRM, RBD, or RNP domain)